MGRDLQLFRKARGGGDARNRELQALGFAENAAQSRALPFVRFCNHSESLQVSDSISLPENNGNVGRGFGGHHRAPVNRPPGGLFELIYVMVSDKERCLVN